MRQIRISRRLFALVDDQDYDRLLPFKWSAKPSEDGRVYAVTNIRTDCGWRQKSMSTMLINPPRGHVVLFKNHWGLDCRRKNLMVVPRDKTQRYHRVRRQSFTGLKGISLESDGRYSALIQVDGVPLRVGTYDTPEEAMAAYDKAIKRYFGKMASLHRPGPDGVSARRGKTRPVPPPTRIRRSRAQPSAQELPEQELPSEAGLVSRLAGGRS